MAKVQITGLECEIVSHFMRRTKRGYEGYRFYSDHHRARGTLSGRPFVAVLNWKSQGSRGSWTVVDGRAKSFAPRQGISLTDRRAIGRAISAAVRDGMRVRYFESKTV